MGRCLLERGREVVMSSVACTLCLALLISASSEAAWSIETVDAGGSSGRNNSLAFDGAGNPGIAYRCCGGTSLRYAYRNGSSWSLEIVDNTGNTGVFPSLAYDSWGLPRISYMDYSLRDLMYAFSDGTSWTTIRVDSTGDTGWFSSIAIDSQDHPHIVHYDRSGNLLKYSFFNGIGWETEVMDSTGGVEPYPSLALDSQDDPHVSYASMNGGMPFLFHAFREGTSWTVQEVDGGTVPLGQYSSLELDPEDVPHISYATGAGEMTGVKYAFLDGNEWTIETVDSGPDRGYSTSLALGPLNTPGISYRTGETVLTHAFPVMGEWHIETVAQASPGETSIGVDQQGNPGIAFWGRGERLDYAFMVQAGTGDSNAGGVLALLPVENPCTGVEAVFRFTAPEDRELGFRITDLAGRVMEEVHYGGHRGGHGSISLETPPAGLYICTMTSSSASESILFTVLR